MSTPDATLRGIYGRLTGLKHSMPEGEACSGVIADDFNAIVAALGGHLRAPELTREFNLRSDQQWRDREGREFCRVDALRSKIEQLIGYLNYVHFTDNNIVEVGSLYNSISDDQLKRRCSDLLTARSDFDRVVNQATQVLEERIRVKANLETAGLSGKDLVNKAINSDVTKSIRRSTKEFLTFVVVLLARFVTRPIIGFSTPIHEKMRYAFVGL